MTKHQTQVQGFVLLGVAVGTLAHPHTFSVCLSWFLKEFINSAQCGHARHICTISSLVQTYIYSREISLCSCPTENQAIHNSRTLWDNTISWPSAFIMRLSLSHLTFHRMHSPSTQWEWLTCPHFTGSMCRVWATCDENSLQHVENRWIH